MKSQTRLDYAVFQLSPKRSRCELFVSSDGNNEKLASGFVKPFVTHLKVAEDQVAQAAQRIKLEVEKRINGETWFTKGTLERFVRFVSTPDVLELVNTLDAEMSQLEAARGIYSQGTGNQFSGVSGRDESGTIAAADATKKELMRAMDGRLVAVRQDLTSACARATAAGFNPDTISDLQCFANRFGAHRLNEACRGFISVYQKRSDLINQNIDRTVRSSTGSDMSIDDPTQEDDQHHSSGSHNKAAVHAHNFVQSNQTTCQQPNSSFTTTFPSRRAQDEKVEFSIEKNVFGGGVDAVVEEKEGLNEPIQTNLKLTRRLSVQDRINLFENKQKENSGGKSAVVGKTSELRRLSSDVSSSFSAAEAAATTTGVVTVSEKAVLRRWSGASDMSIDSSGEKKDLDKDNTPVYTQNKSDCVSIDKNKLNLDETGGSAKIEVKSAAGIKDQVNSDIRVGVVSFRKGEKVEVNVPLNVKDQQSNLAQFGYPGKVEQGGLNNQTVSQIEQGGLNNQTVSQKVQRVIKEQSEFPNKLEDSENEGTESDSLNNSVSTIMKLEKQGVAQQLKKPQDRREFSNSFGSSKSNVAGKVLESEEVCNSTSVAPSVQVQRVRQSKGNQELNDELKLKANELEKLFAEHQLRVPIDQFTSSRGSSKTTEMQIEKQAPKFTYQASAEMAPKPISNRSLVSEPTDEVIKQRFSELSFSDGPRGKLYHKYIEKRDAKLKEEWSTKKVEKEAKMKAMQDIFERSKAELKLSLSMSAEKRDSVSKARLHTEKLRSFHVRSNMKRDQVQPMDYSQSDDDEDISDLPEPKPYRQDRLLTGNSLADSASKTTQVRKLLPGRNSPSPTPHTSVSSVPRSTIKPSNPIAGRRQLQSENPLAQSVPNFSDFRKENTKPSPGMGKTAPRMQVRNNVRNKNSSEDISSTKEEKPRQSSFLRKSYANPVELKKSPLNSEGLASMKFDEQNDISLYDKFPKNVQSKPFLRKGNGIGPGAGSSAAKHKASMASEALRNEEVDEIAVEPDDDSVDTIKGEEEDFELAAEDFADMDNGKPSSSQESERSGSECGHVVRSPSRVDPVPVTELPPVLPLAFDVLGSQQDSPGESPMSWNLRHACSYPQETSDLEASVDSPMGSPASWNSRSLVQTEADDVARMRKKWGGAQQPIIVANSSQNQSRKDMTRGFKRLLKFGRKNRGSESLADWISVTTSEGDDDTEDGRDPANRSSEDLRKSRMGYSQSHPSDYGFNESELYNEQGQSLHNYPTPPANFKLREDNLSGSSLKAPRSFFSLSAFRSKGSDSKLR